MKNGQVDKYISRLVADGGTQVFVLYVPRVLPVLAIAAIHSISLHQLDVESAFIFAPLHRNADMHPHPAMRVSSSHCV